MNKFTIYTMKYCPYCESAKKLLKSKGLDFEERVVDTDNEEEWDRLEKLTGFKTMPQIFLGEMFIGGFTELTALDRSGELKKLAAT